MTREDNTASADEQESSKPGRRLSDRVGVMFFGMGGGFIVHLLWGMALVRLIDKDGVGTYRQVWLVYGIASVIFQLGVPASISYFVPQLSPRRGMGFMVQVFAFMLALGGLMGAFLFFAAAMLAQRLGNPSLAPLFRVFAPYPVFFLPVATIPSLLIVWHRERAAAVLQFAFTAQAPVVSGILLALKFPLYTVFAAVVLTTGALFLGVAVWLFRSARRTGVEWQREMVGRQVRYSTPVGMASAVDTIGRRLDQVVIGLFYPPSRFAIYSVGAFEVPLFTLLSSAMGSVLTPEFVRWHTTGETDRLIRVWHRAIVLMSLMVLPAAVAALAAAHLLITLLYTNAYQESTALFRIYLFILLTRLTQYTMILRSVGRTRAIFWATVGFLLSKTILAIVLVHSVGFLGPAFASVIGHYVYVWLLLRQICAALHLSFARVMPWRDLGRVAALAAVSVLPALPLLRLEWPSILTLATFGSAYGLSFLVLGLLSRVLTRQELALLGRWVTMRPVLR